MKDHEIKIGGLYRAKVAGKLTTVRVDEVRKYERSLLRNGRDGGPGAFYLCTNLATGRRTTFRSAAKFRGEVKESNNAIGATEGGATADRGAGPASQGSDGRADARPDAGPAAPAPAGPVVAAEVGGGERSLEQVCRELLLQAVADGLVTFDADNFHGSGVAGPRELGSGDLVGMANVLSAFLEERS